jgi:chaperone modulatory protein CbpM
MKKELQSVLTGDVLEEDVELSLYELCEVCELSIEQVKQLVNHGLIDPAGTEPRLWRFRGISVRRIHRAQRLQQDLGVNTAGAALALDLLEEIERLHTRLQRLDKRMTD